MNGRIRYSDTVKGIQGMESSGRKQVPFFRYSDSETRKSSSGGAFLGHVAKFKCVRK